MRLIHRRLTRPLLGLALVLVAATASLTTRVRAEQSGSRCYMLLVCTEEGDGCYGDLCSTPGVYCCSAQRPCVGPA